MDGDLKEYVPLRSGKGYCHEGGIRVLFLDSPSTNFLQGKSWTFRFPRSTFFPQLWKQPGPHCLRTDSFDGLSLTCHLNSRKKKSPPYGLR